MRILKLLSKKNLTIILILFFFSFIKSNGDEPVDIWNLNNKIQKIDPEKKSIKNKNKEISANTIYEMQSQNKNNFNIEEEETLLSKKINIVGLYDPEENGFKIDMWSYSDGKKILDLFNKISKIDLSRDAKDILNASLLTNTYVPNINITEKEFLKIKSDWLIRNKNLNLIEEYIIKNKSINNNLELVRHLVDEHLSRSNLKKSCNIFDKIEEFINDNYLSKFNIYCLINSGNRDEAQLLYDLKKELGFDDKQFEKRFNYLMKFEKKVDSTISEKNILEFHLSHRTNPDFYFQPNEKTSKIIWRYLSNSNLLDNIENIDLEDRNRIAIIEKATHDKNYAEKELFNLYKRFQFNINQLLTINTSYKLLSNIESRALIYQGILITNENKKKLELIKILKESFIRDGITNAFKDELFLFLSDMSAEDIPSNYSNFYNKFSLIEEKKLKKIKINNKIIHQSKLLNYFRPGQTVKNISKDVSDILKKTKKNKKYLVSTKDRILLESLKADNVKFAKKYDKFYQLEDLNIPEDIQILINNKEMGLAMLRIVEVIGQDELMNIEPETLYFIISTLNQLDIDPLRNKILLKVLPLKV